MDYLRFAANTIEGDRNKKITHILLSGGYTNSRISKSEALVMKEYLVQYGISTPIILEECSTSTHESIKNTCEIMQENDFTEAYIFCDHARLEKVQFFAKKYLGKNRIEFEIENFIIETNIWKQTFQEFIATPLDILAFYVPVLDQLKRWRKNRIIAKGV